MPGTAAIHLSLHHVMRLGAPPEKVFPLLCPVRERDWLEGWKADLVYAPSGFAEPGCIFTTPGEGSGPWTWIISRHKARAHDLQFVIHAPGSHVTLLDIQLAPEGDGSRASWTYTLTALSPAGEAYARNAAEQFTARMEGLEVRLDHFLRTGTMLVKG